MSTVEELEAPAKSENDKKSYRVIRLENGLKALLISAPVDDGNATDSNKKAACALCVDVGYFSDPFDVQGLAHFLGLQFCLFSKLLQYAFSISSFRFLSTFPFAEHMIFLGSEKYPIENEFEQFMQKSGGSDNASTDDDVTTFYFHVSEHLLDDALDRFSNLIKAPLLLKESMMREREAVDSEFSSRKAAESLRQMQILAQLSRKSHPFAQFDCGNLKTLKDDIDDETLHEKVRDFKTRHYSAHRMQICVQSEESLDALQVSHSNAMTIDTS